jgi:hypothetical protein
VEARTAPRPNRDLETSFESRTRRGRGGSRHAAAARARPTDRGGLGDLRTSDLSRLTAKLDGVAERDREGLLEWRYRGRLVARQLDERQVVIRASFDFRDLLLQSFPETFSVPKRFAKHMMIVADLEHGNADAIEDAVIGAWELQSGK